jgi:hypothetical protein
MCRHDYSASHTTKRVFSACCARVLCCSTHQLPTRRLGQRTSELVESVLVGSMLPLASGRTVLRGPCCPCPPSISAHPASPDVGDPGSSCPASCFRGGIHPTQRWVEEHAPCYRQVDDVHPEDGRRDARPSDHETRSRGSDCMRRFLILRTLATGLSLDIDIPPLLCWAATVPVTR